MNESTKNAGIRFILNGSISGSINVAKIIAQIDTVVEFLETMQPIPQALYEDIYYAGSKYNAEKFSNELEVAFWKLFHALFNHPDEKSTNYWCCAYLAERLMAPKIEKLARDIMSQNRVRLVDEYGNVGDIENECLIAIQQNLPKYDPNVSKFPAFIDKYLQHVGYVFDRMTSPYQEINNPVVVVSSEAEEEKNRNNEKKGDGNSAFDTKEYTARKNKGAIPTNVTSPQEESYIQKEKSEMFDALCELCGIEVQDSSFVTDFNNDKQAICNLIAATKFLGGLDSDQKLTCLHYITEQREERELEYE